jgi:hypothetical protein
MAYAPSKASPISTTSGTGSEGHSRLVGVEPVLPGPEAEDKLTASVAEGVGGGPEPSVEGPQFLDGTVYAVALWERRTVPPSRRSGEAGGGGRERYEARSALWDAVLAAHVPADGRCRGVHQFLFAMTILVM